MCTRGRCVRAESHRAAHLTNRPVVIPASTIVMVQPHVIRPESDAFVTFDGQDNVKLLDGDLIRAARAPDGTIGQSVHAWALSGPAREAEVVGALIDDAGYPATCRDRLVRPVDGSAWPRKLHLYVNTFLLCSLRARRRVTRRCG